MTFRCHTLSEIESGMESASPRGDPNRVADAGRHTLRLGMEERIESLEIWLLHTSSDFSRFRVRPRSTAAFLIRSRSCMQNVGLASSNGRCHHPDKKHRVPTSDSASIDEL